MIVIEDVVAEERVGPDGLVFAVAFLDCLVVGNRRQCEGLRLPDGVSRCAVHCPVDESLVILGLYERVGVQIAVPALILAAEREKYTSSPIIRARGSPGVVT